MIKDLNNLRLGIIVGSLGSRDENGNVVVNFALGRLLEEIKLRLPQTKICLPLIPQKTKTMNHVLSIQESDITALPPLATTLTSQKYYLQTRRILHKFADDSDALFVRLPFQLPSCLLGLKKPKLLQVISNPVAIVNASFDYRGVMKVLARMFAKHLEKTIVRLVHEEQTRTVTNGMEMWELLNCKDGRVVISSCLYSHEMKPRTDFALNHPPKILFVGYMRPEKGIDTLLDAFTTLRQKRDLQLTLAGSSDRLTEAEGMAMKRIHQNPFKSDIKFTGILDYAEPLFDLYRTHDVYVLSSLSEGTPRTIVEALCFGCPVVATNVGGVSSSIEDSIDGLLVEPNNAIKLADAVEKLLDDESLRLKLIENGLARSQELSLNHFADTLVEEIKLLEI